MCAQEVQGQGAGRPQVSHQLTSLRLHHRSMMNIAVSPASLDVTTCHFECLELKTLKSGGGGGGGGLAPRGNSTNCVSVASTHCLSLCLPERAPVIRHVVSGHAVLLRREHYKDKASGELKPGKKGLALSVEQWEKLSAAIPALSAALEVCTARGSGPAPAA